jgi:hypothetical protein
LPPPVREAHDFYIDFDAASRRFAAECARRGIALMRAAAARLPIISERLLAQKPVALGRAAR